MGRQVCKKKLNQNNDKYSRLVATAACRQALNGQDFLKSAQDSSCNYWLTH